MIQEDQKMAKKKKTAKKKKVRPQTEKKRQAQQKDQDVTKVVDKAVEAIIADQDERETPAKVVLMPETSTVAPEEPRDAVIESTPEFKRAFARVLEYFDYYIAYERDAPEEPRLQFWPGNMHITREQVNEAIVEMYLAGAQLEPLPEDAITMDSLRDAQIIRWGIEDGLSIMKKRTGDKFPFPVDRGLKELEFKALSEVSYIEAAFFYRITIQDLILGYIPVSEEYAMRANMPEGSRFRSCVSVRAFTKSFWEVLKDEPEGDLLTILTEYDRVHTKGCHMWFSRWREQDKL